MSLNYNHSTKGTICTSSSPLIFFDWFTPALAPATLLLQGYAAPPRLSHTVQIR